MRELLEKRLPNLSLRKYNCLTGVLAALFSVLLLLSSMQVGYAYAHMMDATNSCLTWQEAAREMVYASDYLTDNARYFVITGEREYLDLYFEEAKVTQRREKSLAALHDDPGLDGYEEAENELIHSIQESYVLMETEYRAMKLAVLGFGLNLDNFPIEVRYAALSPEEEALSPEAMREAAWYLMYDGYYRQEKQAITQSTRECISLLSSVREQRQARSAHRLYNLLLVQYALILALILLVILTVSMTAILIIAPLLKGVLCIREEQPIPVRGVSELCFLARTYNDIYESNRANRKQLAYEARHDGLTRVLNRSGYDYLLKNTNLRTAALILVDVDKFKGVNDTYGHQIGDRILVKVAALLSDHFRAEDTVCRIGGDEFAILMARVGMEHRSQIEKKIRRINDVLSYPTDGLPAVSISAGCAFGDSPSESGTITKDADTALYQVKRNGRCGIAFYEWRGSAGRSDTRDTREMAQSSQNPRMVQSTQFSA